MATAKFYLKDVKSTKKTLINLVFHYDNKRMKYSTKISIEPNNWNNRSQKIKPQVAQSSKLNSKLGEIEEKIYDVYNSIKLNNGTPNKKTLKQRLDIELNRDKKEDFFSYADNYINQQFELKNSTRKDYNRTISVLREFESFTGYLISFESINLDFYDKLKSYLLGHLNQRSNTFGKRIKTIKTIINHATEIGVNKNLNFQKKAFKVLSKRIEHVYLSSEEIDKLIDLELNRSLSKSRDAFVLMCYLGLRYSDYKKINRNNISNGFLDIRMTKTEENISIPLHPTTIQIIEKYNYNLPKLTNTKLNKEIKIICELANIDDKVINSEGTFNKYQLITSHTARRSFATNGYLSGALMRDLMKITGHKKETTFLKYVQVSREIDKSSILNIYPVKLKKAI